jgi:predicted RNase H-like HicB family nuclease
MDEIKRYKIEVFYSDEDKCFIANVPDVKFCSAHGETPEEAVREVTVAFRAMLEVLKESGRSLPPSSAVA